MTYTICSLCIGSGFCELLRTNCVADANLENSRYIRDLKSFALSCDIGPEDWREFLTVCYRDYNGWIADAAGNEIFLDMEEFERPSIREWFRDFCCTPCPAEVTPHVRREALERVRVLATILTARFPLQAQWWGRAANENRAPE